MAGDWIKMRNNLWNDPRVVRLCDMVDAAEATVIGGLYWLWATADEHSTEGEMPGLSLAGIDRKCGVAGLAKALVEIGWIHEHSGGITLLRFTEHNGTSAKKRITDAQRAAATRKKAEQAAGVAGDKRGAQKIVDKDADELSTKHRAKEEKSREKKRGTASSASAGGDPGCIVVQGEEEQAGLAAGADVAVAATAAALATAAAEGPAAAVPAGSPVGALADTPADSLAHVLVRPAVTPNPAPARTRLPEDWHPSEADIAYCRKARPDLDPLQVALGFACHWQGLAPPRGYHADWAGAWRKWVDRERQADARPVSSVASTLPATRQRPSEPTVLKPNRQQALEQRNRAIALRLAEGLA